MHGIGTLSVHLPELRLEEHDCVRLGNDDPSQLTDKCLLQASIPVDWMKPVCVFEAGPRDYKRLKTDASGMSQLTVEISDSSHPDRSLWFWTSFTEVVLHFVREPPPKSKKGYSFRFKATAWWETLVHRPCTDSIRSIISWIS